ncbi:MULTISPECIES: phenylpyruvate tautomerase MIF-related protein [unclassified Synechococcus]|jgi:phenylpyruvate tautomerase|uniref:phenylpyruvate tautomerase MIF-related protein n=1 Tax=unclassified Synechococcus TaxID=2626047 RepID=UPI00103FAD27|nr:MULTISPECIES: phenylpyruvate tautomerase MIF-related protein [unclassified Synechococcus]NDD45042.1 light-inducible protein [Synechococcaceae bacterium WB9_4xB_025]QNG26207.1 light-inducible protein [Synechococcus sp. HK01-R]TCD59402.1 light-inducible protein [Synechococcus sp. BS56D]
MPLINVRTSLPAVKDGSALLQELSTALAEQTGKPEAYVMTLLETGVPMTFAGSADPCAYVEVKSIGALRPPAMTAAFCELIQSRTGIPANRIYIGFDDVQASCWGWNGSTFG